jgi:hypothetical protein
VKSRIPDGLAWTRDFKPVGFASKDKTETQKKENTLAQRRIIIQ